MPAPSFENGDWTEEVQELLEDMGAEYAEQFRTDNYERLLQLQERGSDDPDLIDQMADLLDDFFSS